MLKTQTRYRERCTKLLKAISIVQDTHWATHKKDMNRTVRFIQLYTGRKPYLSADISRNNVEYSFSLAIPHFLFYKTPLNIGMMPFLHLKIVFLNIDMRASY